MDTILAAIGNEVRNGFSKPLDVLCLQEQDSWTTTTTAIVNLLNGLYGSGAYACATLDGATSGAGRPGLIYRTSSIQLLEQIKFGTVSTSAQARQTLRYKLRPVGYGSQADFYVYVNHYKSSDTASDRTRRLVEAQAVRADADALGEGVHILYTGDHNTYNYSTETGLQWLVSAGPGQAFDPVNMLGEWHDNGAYKIIHTQAPAVSPPSPLVGGGMDDRFDWQLCTGEFLDGEGLSYIASSYHTFGNNGTHTLNGNINTGSGASPSVLSLLMSVSDHLPVVADYQLPARMTVSLGAVASPVIVGASVPVEVTVANSANVLVAIGADELDYTVSGTGSVTGTANGTAAALSPGNVHTLFVDTATAGTKNGTVSVTSSSQQVQNGTYSSPVSISVRDHSNGSFSGVADENVLTIDFGEAAQGSPPPAAAFAVHNLKTAFSTAGLDIDEIVASGDTGTLTTNLAPATNLAAASSLPFQATMSTSVAGTFQATYTLKVSDQDLPGATSGADLVLTLKGRVAAPATTVPADLDEDGDVDGSDFGLFAGCFNGSGNPTTPACTEADLNGDNSVDGVDFGLFSGCFNGSGNPPAC